MEKLQNIRIAVDAIVFGYKNNDLYALLIEQQFGTSEKYWALPGGLVKNDESLNDAVIRELHEETNVQLTFMEQLYTFGDDIYRDSRNRVISVAYYALVNVKDYETNISDTHHAQWFSMQDLPELLFDHREMIKIAIERLRYKAAFHPIGFELMPEKFTIPQILNLYEAIYGSNFDKRNFSRKILSTGLLIKLKEKQKGFSKKGAFLYALDTEKYKKHSDSFLNFIPNPEGLV